MKVLVTGTEGQLGYDVVKELIRRGHEVKGTNRDEMDITDKAVVRNIIGKFNPDAVIHCAAYTAVDAAEDDSERCFIVNVLGTENIIRACEEFNAKMMYISTDYVFGGDGDKAWDINDEKTPLNVYGDSKHKGELLVESELEKYFIVRISWVFGKNGNNFVKAMLRASQKNKNLRVVSDQFGSPTYTRDLAVLLSEMIVSDKYGIYHAGNEGFCSWYEFALEIFRQADIEIGVMPVKSSEYPTKAARPLNSKLNKAILAERGFEKLPYWQDALSRYLDEISGA